MRLPALPACALLLLLLLWPGRSALARQLAQATDGVGTGEGDVLLVLTSVQRAWRS